ncbi:MAG TPA: D-alanyl-D-alanine carboxypeptidase/D-alanyl-D-alanine-endopeptidase [Tepidisphaeraceae bacterium]|jgi:D-alanyl-D-alanine carboxypeptidase/D-alanyl-D-alanine-endopeptidase (penicillin-binding protein 4)|nr:D-alanyl-D-alanine carboxypeptidase/D-alanyl-D-alanine-endopeptidase [Tepidisphaeraceae bacterium]
MKRLLSLVLLSFFLTNSTRADLTSEIRSLLQDKSLQKAEVGVSIARLGTQQQPEILFRHQSDIGLIPASNLKIFTTSAALEKLGADFKFRTVLAQRGNDLILIGDGDPTLGDVEMLRKVGWDTQTVFKNWAELLRKQNITGVKDVLFDDSVFDENFAHPNWPADQQHKRYVAQVGGLNLNANCLDFYLHVSSQGQIVDYRVEPPTQYATIKNTCIYSNRNAVWLSRSLGGNDIVLRGETDNNNGEAISVTIHDPSHFAATVMAETLSKNGVTIRGETRRDRTLREAILKGAKEIKVLAIHETPLATVLARANKDSMNLYAECLCKRLGHQVTQQPGSWENGTAAVKAFVTSCGVGPEEVKLDDGCGLSKKNEITANAVMHVLAHDFAGPNRNAFVSSLAVGGEDGTLDKRFRDDLKGRVFAKSGYVSGVSCLSGYVNTKDNQWFAFSILMNGVYAGNVKQIQEKIVKAIDRNATSNVASGQ